MRIKQKASKISAYWNQNVGNLPNIFKMVTEYEDNGEVNQMEIYDQSKKELLMGAILGENDNGVNSNNKDNTQNQQQTIEASTDLTTQQNINNKTTQNNSNTSITNNTKNNNNVIIQSIKNHSLNIISTGNFHSNNNNISKNNKKSLMTITGGVDSIAQSLSARSIGSVGNNSQLKKSSSNKHLTLTLNRGDIKEEPPYFFLCLTI